jgi:hypothetical protein
MNLIIRRKLEMAGRVRDFERSHPDATPGHTAAVARLEDRMTRAEVLAQQEVSGRRAVTGAILARDQLRAQIVTALVMLSGIAQSASKEEPELAVSIQRPQSGAGSQTFVTRSRVAQAAAAASEALLERYGMPANFPAELGSMLDQYETIVNDRHAGLTAHVGAAADLTAVTAELMQLVRQLDALNRFRFRVDPELLGAWKSACNMAWPMKEQAPVKDQPAA